MGAERTGPRVVQRSFRRVAVEFYSPPNADLRRAVAENDEHYGCELFIEYGSADSEKKTHSLFLSREASAAVVLALTEFFGFDGQATCEGK